MAKAKWTRYDMRKVVDGATAKALETIGLGLEGAAAKLAPVDKGRLRASITHATIRAPARPRSNARSGDGVSSPTDRHAVHVGTNVEYAPYVEYGTRKTAAQPFLRPALDDNRKNVRDILSKALSEGFRHGK